MFFTITAYNLTLGIKPMYRLQKDNTWIKINDFKEIQNSDMQFTSHSDAVFWLKSNENLIIDNISANTSPYGHFSLSDDNLSFEILVHRTSMPHLFTLDELRSVLANGDDNFHNALIVDFEGYLKLINTTRNPDLIGYSEYAVRNESYDARNGYVGQTFDTQYLTPLYLNLLNEWLSHLKCGRSMYLDYEESNLSEDDLLSKINTIYSELK